MSGAADAAKGFAAWKFDLLDTVNADPLCQPADYKLIGAYLKFANQDDRSAFLPNSVAYALTGINSATTISKSRQRLTKLGILTDTGARTRDGSTWFKLANPRQELVADHVRMTMEEIREREAFRKGEDRRRDKNARIRNRYVPPKSGTPILDEASTDRRDSAPFSGDEHLERTLGDYSRREEGLKSERPFRDTWEVHRPVLRPFAEIQANRGVK